MHKRRKKEKKRRGAKSLDSPRIIVTDSCLKERFLPLRGCLRSQESSSFHTASEAGESKRITLWTELRTLPPRPTIYRLKPHHSQVEAPASAVTVFGGGAFERSLGLDEAVRMEPRDQISTG